MDKAISELKKLIKVTEQEISELDLVIEKRQAQGVNVMLQVAKRDRLQDSLNTLKKTLKYWGA